MSIRCGSCKDRHATVAEVAECHAEREAQLAEQRAEIYGETYASHRTTGMSDLDARTLARFAAEGRDYFAEVDEAMAKRVAAAGQCEHGLSAALCEGPNHYPADDPYDD